jgi:ATP-dependent DNA helicase PIF1
MLSSSSALSLSIADPSFYLSAMQNGIPKHDFGKFRRKQEAKRIAALSATTAASKSSNSSAFCSSRLSMSNGGGDDDPPTTTTATNPDVNQKYKSMNDRYLDYKKQVKRIKESKSDCFTILKPPRDFVHPKPDSSTCKIKKRKWDNNTLESKDDEERKDKKETKDSIIEEEDDVSFVNMSELPDSHRQILEMVRRGENVVYYGGAGTGKTILAKLIRREWKKKKINFNVLGSTGVASAIHSSITAHSFLGLSKRDLDENFKEGCHKSSTIPKLKEKWTETKALLIDEISMVHADMLDKYNKIAQYVLKNKKPFGGIQIVMCGDPSQLPPVVTAADASVDRDNISSSSSSSSTNEKKYPFFFKANCYKKVFPPKAHVELTKIFRQTDNEFIELLNEQRRGILSEKSRKMLSENTRRTNDMLARGELDTSSIPFICARSSQAKRINQTELKKLDSSEVYHYQPEFQHIDCPEEVKNLYSSNASMKDIPSFTKKKSSNSISTRKKTLSRPSTTNFYQNGQLKEKHKLAQILELKKNCPLNDKDEDINLELRKGARVMLRVNLSYKYGLVNGLMGKVLRFESSRSTNGGNEKKDTTSNSSISSSQSSKEIQHAGDVSVKTLSRQKQKAPPNPIIEFDNGAIVILRPYTWINEARNSIMLMKMMPLSYTWAFTVHKSQGQTLDKAIVDLTTAFEYGQQYVAFSRVRTWDGLFIKGWSEAFLGAHPDVENFYKTYSQQKQGG